MRPSAASSSHTGRILSITGTRDAPRYAAVARHQQLERLAVQRGAVAPGAAQVIFQTAAGEQPDVILAF
jgi:hypothetical protein